MPKYDLTDQNISNTFQNLLQKTGSNDQLYDLLGNEVKNLSIAGTLHAQSYVVTQSTNIIEFSSGSTRFGNSIDDVHIFTGSISASSFNIDFENNTQGFNPRFKLENNNNVLSLPHIQFSSGSTGRLNILGMMDDAGIYGGRTPSLLFTSTSAAPIADSTIIMDYSSTSARFGINTLTPSKELTVTGDISASGKLIGTRFRSTNGAFIGSANDDLFFSTGLKTTTHITASGNISSSGTMTMLTASIGGGIFTSASLAAGGGGSGTITALNNQTANRLVTIGSTTTELDGEANLTYDGTTFTVNDDMQVSSGKLTVDGEITSSEAIFAKGTELDFSISSSTNTHLIVSGTNNEVMIGTENPSGKLLTVQGDISSSGNIILSHITASGDISASGDVYADSFYVDNVQALAGIHPTHGFQFGNTSYKVKLQGTNITLDAPVTASGNITASGTIGASAFSVEGNTALNVVANKVTFGQHIGDLQIGKNATQTTLTVAATPTFIGHITASGNISGSSTSNITIGGSLTANTDITSGRNLTVEGNISGSVTSTGSFGQINTAHGFDDGYHGNDEFIPLLPFDFYLSSDSARSHGVYTDDNGATARPLNAGVNFHATKIIPKGFKATGVRVNCSATVVGAVIPYDGSIANGSLNAHTGGNTNADISLGSQVDGDGETYIVVKFNPAATTDEIQGGKIYITRQ